MQQEGCSCIPYWLKATRDCIKCKLPFTKSDMLFCASYLLPCRIKHGRVHAITVSFHEQCTSTFGGIRDKLVDRTPLTLDALTKMSPDVLQKLTNKCFESHTPNGSFCRNCFVAEQKQAIFPVCSACRTVSYCSTECQNLDWKEHKLKCVDRSKKKYDGKETPLTGKECPCLSKLALEYLKRQNQSMCSCPGCPYEVMSFDGIELFTEQCKHQTAMHTIQLSFCSVKCRKRSIKMQEK